MTHKIENSCHACLSICNPICQDYFDKLTIAQNYFDKLKIKTALGKKFPSKIKQKVNTCVPDKTIQVIKNICNTQKIPTALSIFCFFNHKTDIAHRACRTNQSAIKLQEIFDKLRECSSMK